jgi:hypothetical protein
MPTKEATIPRVTYLPKDEITYLGIVAEEDGRHAYELFDDACQKLISDVENGILDDPRWRWPKNTRTSVRLKPNTWSALQQLSARLSNTQKVTATELASLALRRVI